MSYRRERDEFIARMTKEGLALEIIRALLRAATTLQRYAELECSSEAANNDRVPCPAATEKHVTFRCGCVQDKIDHCEACHGTRKISRPIARKPTGPCLCDDYPAGSHANGKHGDVTRIAVQGDRLERRVKALIATANSRIATATGDPFWPAWSVDFQGDPRGYVLRVIPPSYAERNKGKDRFNLSSIGVPSAPSRLRF